MLIRDIEPKDNKSVKKLIQTVMTEFGAVGEGYSIVDPELDDMHTAYSRPGSHFFVLEENNQIIGCSGIGPLMGGNSDTCELKKMYFLPNARSRGLGKKILRLCLQKAKDLNYKKCYLETLESMNDARMLYEKLGFEKISSPMGNTGHYKCNNWYLKLI